MAVAVTRERPAAMPTLQPIDGFPLHEMKMAVPPLMAAGIRAEPLVLPSGSLREGLAATLANIALRDRLVCHLWCICPPTIGLDGVHGKSQCLCDFLVALTLGAEVLDGCFLFLGHGVSLPSIFERTEPADFSGNFLPSQLAHKGTRT